MDSYSLIISTSFMYQKEVKNKKNTSENLAYCLTWVTLCKLPFEANSVPNPLLLWGRRILRIADCSYRFIISSSCWNWFYYTMWALQVWNLMWALIQHITFRLLCNIHLAWRTGEDACVQMNFISWVFGGQTNYEAKEMQTDEKEI